MSKVRIFFYERTKSYLHVRCVIQWRYVGQSNCSEAGCDKNREGRVCADVAIEKNDEIEIVEDVYDSDFFWLNTI